MSFKACAVVCSPGNHETGIKVIRGTTCIYQYVHSMLFYDSDHSGTSFYEQINCQEAILYVSNGAEYREYCILHNHSWTPLSAKLDTPYPLVDLTSFLLCNDSGVSPDVVKDRAVVVMRGDCDFSQKAITAMKLGAKALLIASNTSLIIPSANDSMYSKVKIPLALMKYRDILEARKVFKEGMLASLYSPPRSRIDPSIIVILLIAVVTVTLGGYWSGACERASRGGGGGESKADSGEISLYSPLKVVIFVALMCGMLVLMYFFYNVLVYIIIAIFCLASASALFSCFDAVLDKLGCGTFSSFSARSILLAAVCITIAVIWGVYRNEERWIWILQDILGIAFCLNFLKTISLSNFKVDLQFVSTVKLLSMYLHFDLSQPCWGQILNHFCNTGDILIPAEPQPPSEKLPVVMRVPWFSAWAQNLCWMQFSILGYGDIIVPGLLVAYCSRFDVWVGSSKRIYFISSCLAYLLGLILTFAVMLLSGMGQPALLYLVPFTLITSAVVAGCRREMKHFWTGTPYQVKQAEGHLSSVGKDFTW
uniref:PA domain-containing protein n=1 Tax=Oryzias sinensis TaxID=183150 RepID=A0A8C8DQC8_9TELE